MIGNRSMIWRSVQSLYEGWVCSLERESGLFSLYGGKLANVLWKLSVVDADEAIDSDHTDSVCRGGGDIFAYN